jgi:adenylate cyclase
MTITNLVADVRGFTTLTQREGSHTVYLLMKKVFDVLTSVVHECKGTIMDHAGDAVYAFWDHSVDTAETQALRASEAALKQQIRIRELRSSKTSQSLPALESLKMGWGITTGPVTMAHYGARVVDLALVGNSVNMAFRLSGRANKDLPCGIVLCSETADLIRGHFPLVDLGPVAIRGRSGEDHLFGIEQRG